MKKEKSVANTSSAPAADSQHSEGTDVLRGLTPNRPLSPRGPKTPKQEAAMEACSIGEKHNVHTGTLIPKPEVHMFCCPADICQLCAIKEEINHPASTA